MDSTVKQWNWLYILIGGLGGSVCSTNTVTHRKHSGPGMPPFGLPFSFLFPSFFPVDVGPHFGAKRDSKMSSFQSLVASKIDAKIDVVFVSSKSRPRDPPGRHPGPSDPQNVCFPSRKTTNPENRSFRSEWPPGPKKCPKRPPNGSQMEPKMSKNASKNDVEKTMKK